MKTLFLALSFSSIFAAQLARAERGDDDVYVCFSSDEPPVKTEINIAESSVYTFKADADGKYTVYAGRQHIDIMKGTLVPESKPEHFTYELTLADKSKIFIDHERHAEKATGSVLANGVDAKKIDFKNCTYGKPAEPKLEPTSVFER